MNRNEQILALITEPGATFVSVAEKLGITKGIVAGVVWRHNMTLQGKSCRSVRKEGIPARKYTKPEKPAKPVPKEIRSAYDGEPELHIMDLMATSCRFITCRGEDDLMRFCGKYAENPLKPYCAHHRKIVYTPVRGYAVQHPNIKPASLFMRT